MAVDQAFKLKNKHLSYLVETGLGWDEIKKIQSSIDHPLTSRDDDPMIELLRIIRNPKNFHFTCKYILNMEIPPFQNLILQELWSSPFPMLIGSRGMSKSTLLSIYAILRALLCQGSKVALIGAVFRQSKVIFESCEKIYNNAPILRDLFSGATETRQGSYRENDKWSLNIGESVISAYPLGTGSTIRGQRAHYLIIDEFATINPEVYENVVQGFAAVSANPVESMKKEAEIKLLKELGLWREGEDAASKTNYKGNQTILAGTAYYAFNHFYKYWQRYRKTIECRGDQEKLKHETGFTIGEGLSWKDFKVFRMPVDLLPSGFMSAKQIARAKMTISQTNFLLEFSAVFASDSAGFFRRSLIEHCTTNKPISTPDGDVQFRAALEGDKNKKYIYGIDPASELDNFSIVILEVHPSHSRIVHCWVTNDKKHKALLKEGRVKEHDFYRYAARKIRDLMKIFPCEHIALDGQGGGKHISEALADPANFEPGDQPIYPLDKNHPLWDGIGRESDNKEGLHILELVQMVRTEYTTDANHGMKKDFESQRLLFPLFDLIELGLAAQRDSMQGNDYDTLEECVQDIEELKDELSLIQHTQTASGRERWDTPETKLEGDKKGRMRKDRYSALVIANAAARKMRTYEKPERTTPAGRFAHQFDKNKGGKMYQGPSWFTNKITQGYGISINRNNRN